MQIHLLGPLEVFVDDAPVDVGGPKAQAILVALAHHLGDTVRIDTLFEALWGDDPPPSARNVIQVRVSDLRRALGTLLDYREESAGYVLASAEADVDAIEFEQLVAQAESQLDEVASGSSALAASLPPQALITAIDASASAVGIDLRSPSFVYISRSPSCHAVPVESRSRSRRGRHRGGVSDGELSRTPNLAGRADSRLTALRVDFLPSLRRGERPDRFSSWRGPRALRRSVVARQCRVVRVAS